MKFRSALIAIVMIFNQAAWAEQATPVCEDAVAVEKGETVPCDGVLLSPDAAKRFDEALGDAKYYEELNLKLEQRLDYSNKEINILDQRLKLYVDQSNVLSNELTKRESMDKWEKFVYFGLGVLATGIAVYGASQLQR